MEDLSHTTDAGLSIGIDARYCGVRWREGKDNKIVFGDDFRFIGGGFSNPGGN